MTHLVANLLLMVLPIFFNVHYPALYVLQEEENFSSSSYFLHLDGLALLSVGRLQSGLAARVKGWDALTISKKANQPSLAYLGLHLGRERILEHSLALGVIHLSEQSLYSSCQLGIDLPLCSVLSSWALASPRSPSRTACM